MPHFQALLLVSQVRDAAAWSIDLSALRATVSFLHSSGVLQEHRRSITVAKRQKPLQELAAARRSGRYARQKLSLECHKVAVATEDVCGSRSGRDVTAQSGARRRHAGWRTLARGASPTRAGKRQRDRQKSRPVTDRPCARQAACLCRRPGPAASLRAQRAESGPRRKAGESRVSRKENRR